MIVKICGITSLDAARAAFEYGADLIGLVFAPSRRRIEVTQAAAIAAELPRLSRVGVFVNQPLSEVQNIADKCDLDFIQLHGDEDEAYCQSLQRPIIRAVRVGADFSVGSFANYAHCSYTLLDTYIAGQAGGTGISFDWQKIRNRIGRPRQRFIVAGGLTPETVEKAILTLQPDGVDVSGGVETNGIKDLEKMRKFIAAARQAARRSSEC